MADQSSVFVLQAVKGRAFPWRLSCSARGCWPSPRAGRCTPASTPSTSLWLQVRAVLGTKPPTSAFINQASRPTERFSCGLEKKKSCNIDLFFTFLQVSSCTPSAARNGGMETEILWCGYGNALPRVSSVPVSARESPGDLSCILAAAGATRSLT